MSEFLLDKEDPLEKSTKKTMETFDTSTLKSNLFEYDIISDTLKHIYSTSKIRKNLSLILYQFYSYPILIIIFSFLLGSFFFGLPMLFIYFKIFENLMKPIIFILLFTLLFSISLLIIRISDDLKNKNSIADKWERKNIVKIIGLSLALIILIVSAFFLHNFFNDLINSKNNGEISFNYNEINDKDNNNNNTFKNDFVLKYIIYCFLLDKNKIINEEQKLIYYYEDSALQNIQKSLLISFIPLFIFTFNKIIKIILIEVKYTIAKLLVYVNYLFLIISIFILYFIDKTEFNVFITSIIEIILISLIYIGYIIWIINSIYKLCKNPKDKNFSIYKYDSIQLLFFFIFDIINIIGSSFIYISILLNFIYYAYNDEKYKNLLYTILFLKIGFLLCIISNSFYYGYYLLSLIFRPISLEYTPAHLKNFYIRANRKLSSFYLDKNEV